MKTYRPPCG